MTSLTIALSGQAAKLHCTFFPEIELNPTAEYYCALLELTTYHAISNINTKNNIIWYKKNGVKENDDYGELVIPTGAYEAVEILDLLKSGFAVEGVNFEYKINKNTMKISICCSVEISSTSELFVRMFGFDSQTVEPNKWVEASDIVRISSQDVIRVKCNIVSSSFIDGEANYLVRD